MAPLGTGPLPPKTLISKIAKQPFALYQGPLVACVTKHASVCQAPDHLSHSHKALHTK